MNMQPFESELRSMSAPTPDPAARARAREAAVQEFLRDRGSVHQLPATRRWKPLGPWSSGLAAAGVAAVGISVYWLLPPGSRVLQTEGPAVQTVPVIIDMKRDADSPTPQRAAAPATPLPPPKMELPPALPPSTVVDIASPQAASINAVVPAAEEPAAASPAPPPAPAAAGTTLQEMVVAASRQVIADKASRAVTSVDSASIESENRDRFEHFDVNPVKRALEESVSTFSADVDTASYSFVRRQLNEGVLPPADAVRVEEMVNYFDYAWPVPASRDAPFEPTITVSDSPWGAGKKLVHIGIKGYELPAARRPDVNLVLLLDVSGSMNSPDKLPLAQRSMALLLDSLKPTDTVAIVVYAGAAGQVLAPNAGAQPPGHPRCAERAAARRIDRRRRGHPAGLRTGGAQLPQGGREPHPAGDGWRLQCRHHRSGGAEILRRARTREGRVPVGAGVRTGQLPRRDGADTCAERQWRRGVHRHAERGAQGAGGTGRRRALHHRQGREAAGGVQPGDGGGIPPGGL